MLATETLPHVEDMEAGFQIWLRTPQAQLEELRRLVARADGDAYLARPGRGTRRSDRGNPEAVRALVASASSCRRRACALAAINVARLTFAMLPMTPSEHVHYPAGLRTYSDIAAPRSPSELVDRIEELERSLWHIATGRAPRLTDASYRRTYGFFDAATRLSGGGFLLS